MAQDIEIQGGVYIVRRHAKLIASGKKSLIVKGVNFSDLVGRSLYAVSKNKVFAIIKLKKPEEMSIKDFDKRREEHKITEKEQQTWFPYASKLYAYKFDIVKVFNPPLAYKGGVAFNGIIKNVKIEKSFFVKIPVNELSPKKIQEMADKEVESLHEKLHRLYEVTPHKNSIEDVLGAHILCISEMKRRGLGHTSDDELDEKTKRYEDEILSKVNAGLPSQGSTSINIQLNAHNYEEIYKEMGINMDDLGCIMLNVEKIENRIPENLLYISEDLKDHTTGFVGGENPHVTLLYGLMENGHLWKKYVEQVLDGWMTKSVKITNVGFFESPEVDKPYYCIVAFVDPTNLMEAHQKLQFLPHIDTFLTYSPHVAIAYIKKDEGIRDILVTIYNKMLAGKELYVNGLNFGDEAAQKIAKSRIVIPPYVGHLEKQTQENQFYRKILYTSLRSQITVMDIKPGQDVGEENHEVDQFIRLEEGIGRAVLNSKTYMITAGDAVLVPAHTDHNIINISKDKELKFYSVYAPPQHDPKEPPQPDKPEPQDYPEENKVDDDRPSYAISPDPKDKHSNQHKHYEKEKKRKKSKPSVRSGASIGTMDYGTSGTSE